MKKYYFMFLTLLVLSSCMPTNFVKTHDVGWNAIQIREDLDYDQAFNDVLDVIAKRFQMDMISKEGGYGRTQWIYTWNTKSIYTKKYRTRVVFKFSADRKIVDVKTEAEYGGDPNWKIGYDTRLLNTMKTDIMGAVGRTTL